jgi:hypothetical protein
LRVPGIEKNLKESEGSKGIERSKGKETEI